MRTIRARVGGDGKGQSSFEGVRRRAKATTTRNASAMRSRVGGFRAAARGRGNCPPPRVRKRRGGPVTRGSRVAIDRRRVLRRAAVADTPIGARSDRHRVSSTAIRPLDPRADVPDEKELRSAFARADVSRGDGTPRDAPARRRRSCPPSRASRRHRVVRLNPARTPRAGHGGVRSSLGRGCFPPVSTCYRAKRHTRMSRRIV